MRIAVLPDLHYGITERAAAQAVLEHLLRERVALVVLGGDIGEPLPNFERALDMIAGLGMQAAVLVGNHDVWAGCGISSEELWQRRLPEACRSRGFAWLESESVVREGLGIVGSIAWYDYSARASACEGKSDEALLRAKAVYNNDGKSIDWSWTDTGFAQMVGDGLVERVGELERRKDVKAVIVLTHCPLFPEQMLPHAGDNPRANAYFGNFTLGTRLEPFRKIRMVVSGHTHRAVVSKHRCADGWSIEVVTVGSDYGAPRLLVLDFDEVLGL